MNGENPNQSTSILLSREELLYVLDLLQAESIPGLDDDPLGELTPEQRTLALIWAERALRARELAQVQDDGDVVLHNTLLTAVGVSAYPQSTLFVYHWPAGAEAPTRYFGHVRGEDVVDHSRPEDVLHRFTLLSSKTDLVHQALTVCEYEETPTRPAFEFTLPGADFARTRELAEAGQTEQARETLVAGGAVPEAAAALARTLSGSPRVSILQSVKQGAGDAVDRRDLTLVATAQATWLIIAPPDPAGAAPLRVRTSTRGEIQTLLAECL
jgi:hypothetical protein